ncbi:MAG TPA: hypothetical protein VF996_00020 [Candidatus Saccharimonadales bacterium]|jgi:hypothetical protein
MKVWLGLYKKERADVSNVTVFVPHPPGHHCDLCPGEEPTTAVRHDESPDTVKKAETNQDN